MEWSVIVSAILVVLSVVLSVKVKQLKTLGKELAEAITTVSAAVEDDNVTKAECLAIVKEWKDVIAAARTLINR